MRDQVFISYSHRDKRFLDELLAHLKPYLRAGSVTAWSDKQIAAGEREACFRSRNPTAADRLE